MKKRKCRAKKHHLVSKAITVMFALSLIVCCASSGTLAWLTASIEPVTNTFVIGTITASISDSVGTLKADSPSTYSAVSENVTYVPGEVIETAPTITISKDSEACYVFIHIEESNNSINNKKIIVWNLNNPDNTWKAVDGHNGYYYTELDKAAAAEGKAFSLLADNKLTVNVDLTKDDIKAMSAYPSITISAATVQADNIPDSNSNHTIDWQDAWSLLPGDFTGASGN